MSTVDVMNHNRGHELDNPPERHRTADFDEPVPAGVALGAAGFPPVLTTAMAAELLQVHVEYLRRMVREGRIPCHRFPGGREMRFLRDELLDWLRAQPGDDQSTSTGRGE